MNIEPQKSDRYVRGIFAGIALSTLFFAFLSNGPEWLVGEPNVYSATDVSYHRQSSAVTSPILGRKWQAQQVDIGSSDAIDSTYYSAPIISLYSVQSVFGLEPDMVESVCIRSAWADPDGLEKWSASISLKDKTLMADAYNKLVNQGDGSDSSLALMRFNLNISDSINTLRTVQTVLPEPYKNGNAFTVHFGSNDMYDLSNILIILEPTHIIKPCVNSDKVDMEVFNRWQSRWNGGLGSALQLPPGHIDRGSW